MKTARNVKAAEGEGTASSDAMGGLLVRDSGSCTGLGSGGQLPDKERLVREIWVGLVTLDWIHQDPIVTGKQIDLLGPVYYGVPVE